MPSSKDSPLFLGIDLGTSSCKVVLCEASGALRARETASYPLVVGPGGTVEQDPEAWWGAIVSATARAVRSSGADPARIATAGCTGQWSGTLAVGKDGAPLRRAIIWMDTRGEPYIRALTAGFPGVSGYRIDKLARWLQKTGGAPAHSGKDSLAHILYLKHREPEVYRATSFFLEPKDYVNYRLTGEIAASWDNVAVTWVTDNRDASHVSYDDALFRLATLDRAKFPPLKAATAVVGPVSGKAARELGVPEGLPVVAGAGDMQASLIGAGCTRPGQHHLYLGTSSWLTAHVPFKKTDIFHNIASLPSALPGLYSIIATQESAGSSLAFVRDLLFGTGPSSPLFEELDRMAAQSEPGSGGVLFTPWLYGERAPVEDRHLRATFFNLGLASGRPQLIRAVMEGVAYNNRWILGPVEKLGGRRADPVRIGGGGASSSLWSQILSDVLGRTVETVEDAAHATARGAALLGAIGGRFCSPESIARDVQVQGRFAPNRTNVAVYDRLYESFLRFHSANVSLHRRLNA